MFMKKQKMPLLILASIILSSCTFSFNRSQSSAGASSSDSGTSTSDTSSSGTSSSDTSSSGTTSSTSSSAVSSAAKSSSSSSAQSSSSSVAADPLTATKDGSTYNAPTKSADSSGTNYSAKSTSILQSEVALSGETPVFPSKGTQNLLVIPVKISDYTANANATNRERIYKAFFGDSSDTSWESLASYYYKSSYGNLLLNGTVSDWFPCGYTASQVSKLTGSGDYASYFDPTWTILNAAVDWYKKTYSTDCSEFDNDGDGYIDGVWLVYSAPNYSNKVSLGDTFWAYTYSNYNNTASVSSPNPFHYCWASYDFMNEGYGSAGIDAHTYIHETGHLLGLDDYYVAKSVDNTKNYGPMGGIDMMDYNIIDHDAYSKFALGWIDPFVVTGSTTITLKPSSTSGEAVLLPTGDAWNGSAFDEYMLLEYYTPDELNEEDSLSEYPGNGVQGFTENGVRIYHVDSRLAKGTVSTSGSVAYTYTDTIVSNALAYTTVAHSNSNSYNVLNTNYRLVQEMDCTKKRNFDAEGRSVQGETVSYVADNTTLFQDGDSFSFANYAKSFPNYYYSNKSTMNDGTSFAYSVDFSNASSSGITLTITKA
jgi:M6 family metalloprotease-like protein